VDLKTGRELISSHDTHAFASFFHERFAATNVLAFVKSYCRMQSGWALQDFGKPDMPGPDLCPYAAISLTNWTLSTRCTPLAKTITLRCANAAPLARSVTVIYTLYDSLPCLDVDWSVEDKTPDPIPEGGWLCFPFAIPQPRFQIARLGSTMDPAKDIIDGANRRLLCLNSGMSITGPDGSGVALCPLDSPLVSLGEPGLWQFSLHYVPRCSCVFVNLYNNQWDTNFPLWQQGSWHSRVRIWSFQRGGDLIAPSWQARLPLLAACSTAAPGRLPPSASGLQLSRPGVLVTHFGPDPCGTNLLLRVWELAGHPGSLTITLPSNIPATRAVPVNLRGEPAGKPLKITRSRFTFALPAFAPASFRLE
jgi:hypothetical protein